MWVRAPNSSRRRTPTADAVSVEGTIGNRRYLVECRVPILRMRLRGWIFRLRGPWIWLTSFASLVLLLVLYSGSEAPRRRPLVALYSSSNATLLDLPLFRYEMESDACGERVYLLIVVHSAPAHFYNRDTIRKTWGSVTVDGKRVRTVFMVARVKDSKLQDVLEAEQAAHRDLVQGSFDDSYRNLTYKHVMGLRWASERCQTASYVMKMDDDIFVDVYRMVRFLSRRYPDGLDSAIGCYLQKGMSVMRDETNKWFVSRGEYGPDTFEDYCSGWAYVLSPVVAGRLATTSRYYRFFWVDDVHVTGTVATGANVRRDPLNWLYTISTGSLLDWTKSKDNLAWRYLVGPTWGDMLLMEEAHRKASRCWDELCPCCSPRLQQNAVHHPPLPSNGSFRGKAEIVNKHWGKKVLKP